MFNNLSYLLFSEKPRELVEFYTQIFGKSPDWNGGDFVGWMVGNSFLTIGPHDKVKGKNMNPDRNIINLETDHVASEFERIKSLQVKVIAEPYHPGESEEMMIATFADPDNNYFQIVSPMGDVMPKPN
jgi:predicted enzyme related to lactoylglutathione lyase